MSILETRLTVHRRQYDERRRYVADLERLAERFRADASRLLGDLDRAGHAAAITGRSDASALPSLLFERYRQLEHSVSEIEGQIAAARDALAAAEQQLKAYEATRSHRAGRGGPADRFSLRRARRSPFPAAPLAGLDDEG